MTDSALPINLGYWLLALSPIVLLLVLLAVLRWKAPEAGPAGMFLAAVVALVFFRTPFETLAVGVGKGVWDAVFILLVIWPALLLYRVGTAAGAFDALRRGLSRYSRNHVFLVLGFGWVFASFTQGIAGFGAPIAIVAPLLLAIGVRPLYAVAIPLIGHAWANMFGTLAVGWIATLQVVELDDELATALITAVLLAPVTLMAGVTIAWMAGKGRGVRIAWPLILIISALHAGLQFVIMYWEPLLSAFLASTVALVALYPLSRWSRYREPARDVGERPAMRDDAGEGDEEKSEPVMGLGWALLPYAVLTLVAVLTLAVPPVVNLLDQVEFGPPFPEAGTGFDVVNEGERPYSPIAPFTHPGFSLAVAVLVTWLVYRSRGFFARRRQREGRQPIWSSLATDATPASVAILSFLVLAAVMEHSGQTDVLAQGLEQVSPPLVYAFLANIIGLIGAFMTSSNTASNVLFAQLQQGVATGTGLSGNAVVAAQSAGGAIGNAVAPANIVLGTGTAGIVGQEGAVLRKTLPWTLAAAVVIGLLTLLFV
ncbi:L-lactate permease [Micromonospora halophytica]|uniref:L-lactate permease n=1 Tax=Micromonospora halophytica TaxID=47864 RepID=A0A1C5GVR8_9ACTN|nr:L-lactate permease [Micromonospora halophytica]SCG37864.1 lactate permease [Micromonospora halophytica]